MNIARASPFNYQNGRIRSSRRQLCWLYCDSMQIPPTAILQPIAPTISSIVFPASQDRATNRKNDRFIAFYSGTSFHCIVLRNPHHPVRRIRYICRVNCCEFLYPIYIYIYTYMSSRHIQKIMQLKSLFGSISRYFEIYLSLQRYKDIISAY